MQGPNALLNVVTIPPGAQPGSPRIVINGIAGSIDVYSASGLAISITSDPVAVLVYQPA